MKLTVYSVALIFILCINSNSQVVQDYIYSNNISETIETTKKEGTRLWNLQNHAVQYSFIGRYKESIETHLLFQDLNKASINPVKGHKPDLELLRSYKPVNAIKAVSKEAKNYRIVITNEAHYQPQNRVFTTSLLKSLYRQGFRYFAAEDLAINDKKYKKSEDNELNTRKYPVRKTGYYVLEPQYGNLIKTALEMGYTLVPYEDFASEIADPLKRAFAREAGQAKNIANVLKKDPKAKILVHSGYGHLNEHLSDDGVGLMGAMLKKNHGIDPLTVDQTTYLPENQSPYYTRLDLESPSVLVGPDEEAFAPSDETITSDMKVFFPRTKYTKGRPNWLFYAPDRKFLDPNFDRTKVKFPALLMAFRLCEKKDEAIPADVIELSSPSDYTSLVLEKGRYDIVIKSMDKTMELGEFAVE